jgi:site-specific DNA-cytosine methylase
VFVVGRLIERGARDWTAATEVLALEEGLRRHLEAQSKKGKSSSPDAEGGARGGCWWDGTDCAGTLTKQNAGGGQRMPDKDNLGAVLQPIGYRWQNNRDGLQQDDAVAAMRASTGSSGFHEMNHPVVVAHAFYSTGGTHGVNQHPEVSPAVKVGSGLGIPSPPAVAQAMTVRRLTPRECERLQGFPDDYTLIPWRKKSAEDCPDGPRYKALGNSMACNCMAWIGERIAKWEAEHER